MADRWIVSSYDFTTHNRLDIAEREARRLQVEEPRKYWRIYRVKTTLPAANTKAVLTAATDLCAHIGVNMASFRDPLLIAFAAKLQYEIATRTEMLHEEQREELWMAAGNA